MVACNLQNPLKNSKANNLEKRLKYAKKIVKNSRIIIDALEIKYKNNYTANTLNTIVNQYTNLILFG